MIINGTFCHEHGCPNERKTFIEGEWILLIKCFDCGFDVEHGTMCECQMAEDVY
jgi:hypothetical protein